MRRKPARMWLALLILSAGMAAPTWAGDPTPFDDLLQVPMEKLVAVTVDGASKRPQPPEEAPSMVSLITADEIRHQGWRTLDEALASLRGVHVTSDRANSYLGIRGFGRPGDYNSRLLLLIDGLPINDGVYDQALIGNDFPLDLALIERIEYVPGPGSALYGGNAFFGVVNIVTMAGAKRGREAEITVGEAGQRGMRATFGHRTQDGDDWLLSASREHREGRDMYFESYAAPGANAWSRGLDHRASERLFARFSRGGLTATLLMNERSAGLPGGPYGIDLNDPASQERERHALANVRYEYRLNTTCHLDLNAYLGQYSYNSHWAYDSIPYPDFFENRYWGGEGRITTRALPAQTLVAGFSWRRDEARRQINPTIDTDSPRGTMGIFLQDDWKFGTSTTLSAGLRHDRDSFGRSFNSPRLALITQPGAETTVKLIVGRAFRPPNAFETDYAYEGDNIANPTLHSEHIRSTELGMEHRLGSGTTLSMTLYRNRIDHLIALETDPLTGLQQHHNVGGATLGGLEVEVVGRLAAIELRASMAWQNARHESGIPIANSPRRLSKLLFSAPLPGNLRLSWETHLIGRRNVDTGDVSIPGATLGGHGVSHGTLSGHINQQLGWLLRISNLFDRKYADVTGAEFNFAYPGTMIAPMTTMPQDGRTLLGRLIWKF
ncbi:TonB-dependent receptor plug domain-containing protein [Denitratisoma oestradiolicum]|nr:TonB-dependent receptor [Denitratisoma oestradiolicum]